MKATTHPILKQLAFLTRVIEHEISDPISIELATQEREKIIVQCSLN